MLNSNPSKIIIATLALIFFLIGTFIFKSYGISADEDQERLRGLVAFSYVIDRLNIPLQLSSSIKLEVQGAPKLENYPDGDHGTFFDQISAFLELALNSIYPLESQDAFYLRHFLTFLFFFLGVVFTYKLANRRFNDWRIGLLAAAFLILSPRIFAEGFYNSKDIVFMSLFTMATYTSISFIKNPTFKNTFLHGFATGIAIDVRIMAVVIPLMTLLIIFLRVCKKEISLLNFIYVGVLYIIIFCIIGVIFWPWLWTDPFGRFSEAFMNLSKYPWNGLNLYFGEFISSQKLPWHYAPVWITLTTPPFYIALLILGSYSTIASLFRRHYKIWSENNELQDLIFLGLFLAPILAVILLHSTLYDGWRHLYFIYPPLLLVAIKGWVIIYSKSYSNKLFALLVKPILISITLISLISTAVWMIRAHPLQNVYFNFFAGKNWHEKFDLDYWGLSNRMALDYILGRDKRAIVTVATATAPNLYITELMLSSADKARFMSTTIDRADYLINHYRNNKVDYSLPPFSFKLLRHIKVGGEIVSSIYMKGDTPPSIPDTEIKKRIDFNKGGSGVNLLVGIGAQAFDGRGGWSYPESWGTWSDGKSAQLLLPLPSGDVRPKKILFSGIAFTNFRSPYQEVEVYLNGLYSKKIVLASKDVNLFEIELPAHLKRGYLVVDFRFLNPIKPNDFDGAGDERLLSLGLISATFE